MNEQAQAVYDILRYILVILLICGLGLLTLNQFLSLKYKTWLMNSPCGVCADRNPYQSQCIKSCFDVKVLAFNNPINYSLDQYTNQIPIN